MKPQATRLLVAIIGCGALLASVPAWADRNHRDHRHDRYTGWGYGDAREWPGYRGYERGHKHHRRPIKEKVIVREYRYYEPRRYRHRPDHGYDYRYSRDPAIVIGVNIPPIVIPLR